MRELCCVELFKFDHIFVDCDIAVCVECVGPYHVESTSSRPITEVKQHWAALVLGWVTAWEYAVSYTFNFRCFSRYKLVSISNGNNPYKLETSLEQGLVHCLNDQATLLEITL